MEISTFTDCRLEWLQSLQSHSLFTIFYPGIFFPEMLQTQPGGSRFSAGHDRVISETDKIPQRWIQDRSRVD